MNRAFGLVFARGYMNVCAIVSFLGVGRFLGPTEFGLYAIASSAVFLCMSVIGAGFTEHVISRDPTGRDEPAAFWLSALLGFAGGAGTFVAGYAVDHFLHQPDLGSILFALAPLPAIWGLGVIYEAVLIRDNRGGTIAVVLITAETIGLIVLFAGLSLGAGIFSLVISRLFNNLLTCGGYWLAGRVNIWSRIHRQSAIGMIRYSSGVIGSRLVGWLDGYGSDLLLAAVLAPAGLGQYRMGSRLVGAPVSILVQAPGPAQLAYLGEKSNESAERVGRILLKTLQLHWILIAPLFAVLAVCGQDVVDIVLNDSWKQTGAILTVLAIAALPGAMMSMSSVALLALGRSHRFLVYQAIAAVIGALALVTSAAGGPFWTAVGKASVGAAMSFASLFVVTDITPALRGKIYGTSLRIMFAAAVCAITGLMVSILVPRQASIILGLLRIAVIGIVAVAAYIAVLPFICRSGWLQLRIHAQQLLSSKFFRRVSVPRRRIQLPEGRLAAPSHSYPTLVGDAAISALSADFVTVLRRYLKEVESDPGRIRRLVYDFARHEIGREITPHNHLQARKTMAALEAAISEVEYSFQNEVPFHRRRRAIAPLRQNAIRTVQPARPRWRAMGVALTIAGFVPALLFVGGMTNPSREDAKTAKAPVTVGATTLSLNEAIRPTVLAEEFVYSTFKPKSTPPLMTALPATYGVYALQDGRLNELSPTVMDAAGDLMNAAAPSAMPSRGVVNNDHLTFVIYRPEFAGVNTVDVHLVSRFVGSETGDDGSRPDAGLAEFRYPVKAIPGHPDMLWVRADAPGFDLVAGQYLLKVGKQAFGFTIVGSAGGRVSDSAPR